MDRFTRSFIAGCVGCLVKSTLNTLTAKTGIMYLRNSTVGSDLVLGKSLIRRRGTSQYLVGELASTMLGAIWGTLMGIAPPPKGEKAWIARGLQMGSIAWFIDQSFGARALPRSIQGSVRPLDSIIWFTQHLAFGLTASYLLDGNPQVIENSGQYLKRFRVQTKQRDKAVSDVSEQQQDNTLVNIPYWLP